MQLLIILRVGRIGARQEYCYPAGLLAGKLLPLQGGTKLLLNSVAFCRQ